MIIKQQIKNGIVKKESPHAYAKESSDSARGRHSVVGDAFRSLTI